MAPWWILGGSDLLLLNILSKIALSDENLELILQLEVLLDIVTVVMMEVVVFPFVPSD